MAETHRTGETIARFTKWLSEHGVSNLDKFEIADFGAEMGLGVKCKSSFSGNNSKEICAVPRKLWLAVQDTLEHPTLAPVFAEKERVLAPYSPAKRTDLVLAIRLMYEYNQLESSFWAPWINILPRQLSNSTLFWSEQDLAGIDGTNLEQISRVHRSNMKNDFVDIFAAKLSKRFPALFPRATFTQRLFEWALSTVMSHRVLDSDALVPFIDLFNHSSQSKLVFNDQNGSIEALSDLETVTAGEQILVNYNKPNVILLERMGFAVENNPKDQVEMYLQMDPATTELYSEKVQVLKHAGIPNPNGPYYLRAEELIKDFPLKVLGACRIQHATADEFSNIHIAFNYGQALSMDNEVSSIQALEHGITTMLKVIRGDHREDLTKFITIRNNSDERKKLSQNAYYSLIMRLSDRTILGRALYHIQTHKTALARYLQATTGIEVSNELPGSGASEDQKENQPQSQ